MEGKTVPAIRASEGEANPLFQEIRRHGVARELPLVVETLRALALGRVAIREGQVVDESGSPIHGLDLTEEIERVLKSEAQEGGV